VIWWDRCLGEFLSPRVTPPPAPVSPAFIVVTKAPAPAPRTSPQRPSSSHHHLHLTSTSIPLLTTPTTRSPAHASALPPHYPIQLRSGYHTRPSRAHTSLTARPSYLPSCPLHPVMPSCRVTNHTSQPLNICLKQVTALHFENSVGTSCSGCR
jgi:hypothetical protein